MGTNCQKNKTETDTLKFSSHSDGLNDFEAHRQVFGNLRLNNLII